MCTLYALTRPQDAVRRHFKVGRDRTGNLPALPAIFPDQLAPVIRLADDGERVMEIMRWGFPPPPNAGKQPITNVRNVASAFWRPWLGRQGRCLMPVSSFCEYTDATPKVPHWFALGTERPLFAFAGIWRTWVGTRKGEDKEHRLFAFLTTEPNDVVRPIHAKAMPVVLTAATADCWLEGDVPSALSLQRPFESGLLHVVATGARADG
jgi:putative SOS response-associated peptidase YedK